MQSALPRRLVIIATLLTLLLPLGVQGVQGVPLAHAQGGVTLGTMAFVFFPADFPGARSHPLTGVAYHPGGPGTLNLVFLSTEGTGVVTLTASSTAFAADATESKALTVIFEPVVYTLSFSVRANLDGVFPVTVTAKNESGEVLDFDVEYVPVWSQEHVTAGDSLLTGRTVLATLSGELQSSEARAGRLAALETSSRAQSAFSSGNWAETTRLAEQILSQVRTAESAESAFLNARQQQAQRSEERRLAAEESQAEAVGEQIELQARSLALQEDAMLAEQEARSAVVIREYAVAAALGFVVVGGAVSVAWLVRRRPASRPSEHGPSP